MHKKSLKDHAFLPPSDSAIGTPAGQATPQRPEFLRRAASSGGFSNRDAEYHRINTPPSHISVHSSPSGYATPQYIASSGRATPNVIDPEAHADIAVAHEEAQRQAEKRRKRQIAEQATQTAQPSMTESFVRRTSPNPPQPPAASSSSVAAAGADQEYESRVNAHGEYFKPPKSLSKK